MTKPRHVTARRRRFERIADVLAAFMLGLGSRWCSTKGEELGRGRPDELRGTRVRSVRSACYLGSEPAGATRARVALAVDGRARASASEGRPGCVWTRRGAASVARRRGRRSVWRPTHAGDAKARGWPRVTEVTGGGDAWSCADQHAEGAASRACLVLTWSHEDRACRLDDGGPASFVLGRGGGAGKGAGRRPVVRKGEETELVGAHTKGGARLHADQRCSVFARPWGTRFSQEGCRKKHRETAATQETSRVACHPGGALSEFLFAIDLRTGSSSKLTGRSLRPGGRRPVWTDQRGARSWLRARQPRGIAVKSACSERRRWRVVSSVRMVFAFRTRLDWLLRIVCPAGSVRSAGFVLRLRRTVQGTTALLVILRSQIRSFRKGRHVPRPSCVLSRSWRLDLVRSWAVPGRQGRSMLPDGG